MLVVVKRGKKMHRRALVADQKRVELWENVKFTINRRNGICWRKKMRKTDECGMDMSSTLDNSEITSLSTRLKVATKGETGTYDEIFF